MTAPPIPYYGSKMRIAPYIAQLLPPHEHYVEPFAGSLAVLLAKPPSNAETVNDVDHRLMTFWRVLRDRPRDLAWVCGLTPHSRNETTLGFADVICDHDPPQVMLCEDCDLEVARRVFTVLTQARAGRLSNSGWRYRISTDGKQTIPDGLDVYVARLIPVAARLRHVSLECAHAFSVIDRYGVDPDVCIYADPPYIATTRAGAGYRHEMSTEPEHRELAEALHECNAAVVLSGYRSNLYDELYDDWYREELPTTTNQGGARKATCEVLWANRPLGNRYQPALFEVGNGQDG